MCNLYSLTKGQAAVVAFIRAMRDRAGNLPPLPGIFPDYIAPVVRNAADGVRELAMARWGMPGPPAFGGAPITNVRNTKSPHWRRWLKPRESLRLAPVRPRPGFAGLGDKCHCLKFLYARYENQLLFAPKQTATSGCHEAPCILF